MPLLDTTGRANINPNPLAASSQSKAGSWWFAPRSAANRTVKLRRPSWIATLESLVPDAPPSYNRGPRPKRAKLRNPVSIGYARFRAADRRVEGSTRPGHFLRAPVPPIWRSPQRSSPSNDANTGAPCGKAIRQQTTAITGIPASSAARRSAVRAAFAGILPLMASRHVFTAAIYSLPSCRPGGDKSLGNLAQ